MKNLLLLLAAALLAGGNAIAQNTADDFPNAPPGMMLPILADGTATITGRINSNTDLDVFSFQAGPNGGVRIYTTGTTDTNGVLRRQSSSAATGWTTITSEEGGTGNFTINRVLDAGFYSIQVGGRLTTDAPAGTAGGTYVLRVEFTAPTPVSGDIDLPEVPRGSTVTFAPRAVNTSTGKTVTIRNTGNGSLQVNNITVSSTAAGNGGVAGTGGPFYIESGAARTIAAGGSSTFRVVFRPLAEGNFTGVVNVPSNDPDENPWSFIVTGSSESAPPPPPPGKPEIGLALGQLDVASGGTVDFGVITLPANSVVTRELIITNTGDANLNLGAVTILALPTASPLPSAPPGFFRVLSPPAPVVEPGRSTVLRIGAGPTSATNLVATPRYIMEATIPNNDDNENPYRLILTAEIQTAPPPAAGEIAVFSGDAELSDDGTLNLGTTRTGVPIEKVVTIRNTGDSELRLNSIVLEWNGVIIAIWPPPPLPFRVEGVEPRTVPAGGSTTCRVIFPATSSGPAEALLVINNSDANENPFTLTVKAVAEGEPPPPPQSPEIAVSLAGVDLPMGGTVDFGRTSLTVPVKKEITIANTGNAVLNVRSAILPAGRTPVPVNAAGADNGVVNVALPFRFTGEPVAKVEPGARRTLSVIFQPRSNGSFEAMLMMSNNDRDENPYKLKLTGQGGTDSAALPDIALSLGDAPLPQGGVVDFGQAAPGTSVTREIRITNSGLGDLRLGRISFSGPAAPVDPANGANAAGVVVLPPVGALPFRALLPPNNVVPAGRSAILRVVYVAPPSGSHEAVMSLESNDPDESPYRVSLRGRSTGTANTPPEISVSAGDAPLAIGGTLNFGPVVTGASVRREIRVSNTGGGELRISGFTILPAEFMANDAAIWMPPNALVRVVSGPGVIAAGSHGVFVLEMMGFTPGPARLQARIGNNDLDENPYSFAITGEVVAPPVVDPVGGVR